MEVVVSVASSTGRHHHAYTTRGGGQQAGEAALCRGRVRVGHVAADRGTTFLLIE